MSNFPGARVVRVRAWRTDEAFGNDRWKADEYSLGRGTHEGVLVLCRPGETGAQLRAKLEALLKGDADG